MITISREMESGESASFDSLRRRQNRPSAGAESDWRTVARLNSPGRFHHRKEAVEKDLDARDPNFIADARRYLGIETGDRGGGGPGKSNE